MGRLEAVIFDLDGVIADTARLHDAAWAVLADRLGIPFEDALSDALKGVSRMKALEIILKHGGKFESFSEEEKIQLAEQKNRIYQEKIQTLSPVHILPGISALLSELQDANIKIGLASASKNANAVLQQLKLHPYFDVVVPITDHIQPKPHPQIFLCAAHKLEVHPSCCIGIEDAAVGVTSIVRSGMFAIGIGDKEILYHAHVCFSDTYELTLSVLNKCFEQHQKG